MKWVRKACLGLLRLAGWSSALVWPPESRGLILVYPHTSNWDFVVGVLFRIGHGLPAQWLGKDTLFRWPFGALLRAIGGLAVNRRESTGLIAALCDEFRRREWLWLAVTPEGTRSYTDHLKSGFYQLALAADLPIGLGCIDFGRRRVAIENYVRMTGDVERDLATLRDFYADKQGRRSAEAGQIRFRDTAALAAPCSRGRP